MASQANVTRNVVIEEIVLNPKKLKEKQRRETPVKVEQGQHVLDVLVTN